MEDYTYHLGPGEPKVLGAHRASSAGTVVWVGSLLFAAFGLFLGYLLVVGQMPDIRRVFQYHGAEHMTIHALEAGDPLIVENVRKYPTAHQRCGTEFLVVVIALSILGWPGVARLMRGAVLQVKPNDYVQAARALGATPWRIIRAHVLPNALAPMIVVATINLGVFIAVEATLSFLGIGLTPPAISWGVAISDAIVALRTTPHILLFPSLFLSLAVLAFIMLGDAVRDAFDPKSR